MISEEREIEKKSFISNPSFYLFIIAPEHLPQNLIRKAKVFFEVFPYVLQLLFPSPSLLFSKYQVAKDISLHVSEA
jgi:hypothetical protein